MPNGSLRYLYKPICVLIVRCFWLSAATFIYLYARARSSLVIDSLFANVENTSSGVGSG